MKPNHKKQGEEADAMIIALQQEAKNGAPDEQGSGSDDAITSNSTDADNVQQSDPPPTDAAEADPEGTPADDATATDEGAESTAVTDDSANDIKAQIASIQSDLAAANQRWKVAQGMIEKKDSELEHLRTLLAGLASQQASAQEETNTQSSAPAKQVTAADIEDFGQPMYEFVSKVATDIANELLNSYDATVNSRVATVEQSVDSVRETTNKNAVQRFEEQLDQLVPDWREINVDPGFGNWVSVVDDYAGVPRLDLLRQAYDALDARRTAVFFTRYKESLGGAPAADPPADSSADSAATAPARNPAKHISPGKSKAPASNASETTGRTWSRKEIADVYDMHMSGRMSHEEFAKAERDIFKAQREGRITM